ncbi:hypothetical protein ACFBZI_11245 [Moraxella sp. ZJ142]|uniref:hypothetical protein n=1 Tax=Moraxella marmotae TaxID=3344520 RepID=UPI0035D496E2
MQKLLEERARLEQRTVEIDAKIAQLKQAGMCLFFERIQAEAKTDENTRQILLKFLSKAEESTKDKDIKGFFEKVRAEVNGSS